MRSKRRQIGVGFALQPDPRFLELCEPLFPEVDYFEVCPETTWRRTECGDFEPNDYQRLFLELGERFGAGFVAHGVGFSLGSAERDSKRDARWLSAIERDARDYSYAWYTDHLGVTVLDGRDLGLPLPLPHTEEAREAVRAALDALSSRVPAVGFENSAFPFWLEDPHTEPDFIGSVLEPGDHHLLLDLHNLATNAENGGFDPLTYLEKLPLERVIELHVSGGSRSDPAWLPEGRTVRLDSHDAAVPQAVWDLAESAVRRCPNLRGITLERMEGTVASEDVEVLAGELERVRRLAKGAQRHAR